VDISKAFPKKYLAAEDLPPGKKIRLTIKDVQLAKMGGESGDIKPVMFFEGKEKGMALNQTNAGKLSAAYGKLTEAWEGKEVLIFVEQKNFQGRSVPGLSVEVPMVEVADDEEPPF
jgi:hypothetical protein